MLGSLKAYYRKLRTFKGTIRALINLRRTPLSLSSAVKAASSVSNGSGDLRRNSAVLEVPRISAAGASTVQSQVQKLVAEGRVVAEVDRTSGMEVTYRQQGNLDHYTEDNLAKRVSLQQDPHMIALTQRLWNCALRNGDKKLKYGDYETYMLCLHRLILPEFDIAASKELIADDWKRDSGEQDYLDYAVFHLSMFELVDLWTDTVDPEDYISLLYCITHCLTYLLNEHHMLKSLIDVSNVDILKESKGVTLEIIKEDLQRELNGESFAYFRDQVRLVTEANQAAEREVTGTSRPRRVSQSQQGNRSRSRDRKRSTSRSGEKDNFPGGTTTDLNSQHRRSRSGSSDFGQDPTKRKFSVQASANSLYLTANASGFGSINGGAPPLTTQTQNYPADAIPVSPRREVALQRATSPNVFARGGGVILNIGTMDGMVISMSTADGKSSAAVSTTGNAAFPRRRSRSASNSSQQRRDQAMQTAGKMDITREAGLQVNHIEATKSVLRTGSQDPNAAGYILLPSASSGKSREPFTVRAAAVAVAAASMASAAAPVKPQQALSIQRTQFQVQQRSLQSNQDGIAASVVGGSTKNIPPNVFINNSSLTAPLMTIVSSKAPTPLLAYSEIMETEALGLRWWDEELLQTQVSFRTAFFPALLRSCDPQSLPSELSRDELRVVTQFCISPDANQSGQVTREDFRRFLARFGPLELSLSKLVACFCANQELVPWFHGDIGRQEAESVLAVRERSDGAFLVRFSESHPTKFTLTYLKVHSASSSTPGRRELKNCLVRNLGEPGYALSEAVRRGASAGGSVRQRTYPSIGAFIQSSSGRLKYGVASNFSAKCNQELAVVRAVQDHQSDSYSAFSTESFGTPEPPPGSASMLFSRSPPSQSFLGMPTFPLNANSKAETSSNSYASFIVDSLAPPTVHSVETQWQTAPASIVADKKPTLGNWNGGGVVSSPGPFGSSDYGNFASFAQHQPEEEAQPVAAKQAGNKNSPVQHHYRSPEASTSAEYGTFANLALTYAHESQQLAAQGHQTVSLSRSPTSTARTGFDTSGYGSFASVAITKPTSSTPVDAANSSRHQRSNNRGSSADNDYGSFASITNELEDKRPQWEQTLGPPPPPMAVKTSFDPQTTRPSNAIYENFASVSLAGHDARSQEKEPLHVLLEKPPARATPSPNSDVYGSFDAAAANPTIKTTPITSALDELNIGMEFYKQKRLDDALLRFILAQELARSTGDQVVEARALGNLGTVYLDKKNPQQAVRCYQQCLDITRAIEDTKRERTILNNLVLALVASEDFERALACCQVQLETTTNAINRRKIISRMSLLREKMTRQTSR
ncbi:hypothetical protein KRP22_008998 [Phytophthora ramorum]|nr:hypothetical protein KRP22_7830 [Phytophthora ramorum]